MGYDDTIFTVIIIFFKAEPYLKPMRFDKTNVVGNLSESLDGKVTVN